MEIVLVLFLSFVPMLLYAAILWWLDRYEKEPFGLLVVAFLWGAIPAVLLAVIFELVLDIPFTALASSSELVYNLLGASLGAPLVEETTKGLALLLLFLFWRKELDSPLDGLIYGGMVGFGFAAVENVLYLGSALDSGGLGGALGLAFFRAGLFGLNHAMYTGFTGVGLALTLEWRRKYWYAWLLPFVGFGLAAGVHAFHNTFSTFWSYTDSGMPLLILTSGDWLGVVSLLVVVVWALMLERQRIARYMGARQAALALQADEVKLLLSPWRRGWALLRVLFTAELARWWQLRGFFKAVTEIAFAWHRYERGDRVSAAELQRLEQAVLQGRSALVALRP